MDDAKKPNLVGAAGEHYVMCELLRRSFIAALAPVGVPNADIVVTDVEGRKICAIQVKARRDIGADRGWHMKPKHEKLIADGLFYCFVQFQNDIRQRSQCWIVPSRVVAHVLTLSHKTWLSIPGRNGRAHQDNAMRRFGPDYTHVGLGAEFGPGWLDRYEDAWDQLSASVQN
jgi:hypothetical protein